MDKNSPEPHSLFSICYHLVYKAGKRITEHEGLHTVGMEGVVRGGTTELTNIKVPLKQLQERLLLQKPPKLEIHINVKRYQVELVYNGETILLLDTTEKQTKSPVLGMGYLNWSN